MTQITYSQSKVYHLLIAQCQWDIIVMDENLFNRKMMLLLCLHGSNVTTNMVESFV